MSEQIEGVPDGWRLVRIGKPKAGEYYIEINGEACEAKLITPTVLQWVFPIIEKIEQPKQYRPFANSDEFLLHSLHGDWLKLDATLYSKIAQFDSKRFWLHNEELCYTWEEGFNLFKFRNGSPFGVEVTE